MSTYPTQDVKDRLLEAAVVCLRRQGFAATRARDVTREAGVSLRSISYHYGSTRGLLLAAISMNWRRWLAPLISASTDPSLAPAARLQAGLDRFSSALEENRPMLQAWLEAVTVAQHDSELCRTLAANQDEFRRALARTLADDGQPDADSRAAAIITVCDGAVVRFLLHSHTPAPAALAQAASLALATHNEPSQQVA